MKSIDSTRVRTSWTQCSLGLQKNKCQDRAWASTSRKSPSGVFYKAYTELFSHCLVGLYTLRLNYYDPVHQSCSQKREHLFEQLKAPFNPQEKSFAFRLPGFPCAPRAFSNMYGLSVCPSSQPLENFRERRFSIDNGNEENDGRPVTAASFSFRARLDISIAWDFVRKEK